MGLIGPKGSISPILDVPQETAVMNIPHSFLLMTFFLSLAACAYAQDANRDILRRKLAAEIEKIANSTIPPPRSPPRTKKTQTPPAARWGLPSKTLPPAKKI